MYRSSARIERTLLVSLYQVHQVNRMGYVVYIYWYEYLHELLDFTNALQDTFHSLTVKESMESGQIGPANAYIHPLYSNMETWTPRIPPTSWYKNHNHNHSHSHSLRIQSAWVLDRNKRTRTHGAADATAQKPLRYKKITSAERNGKNNN
jgi:hypothetical protein